MTTAKEPLSKADLNTLGHLRDFRTGTAATVTRALAIPDDDTHARLTKLGSRELVRTKEFLDGTQRYELTPSGARVLGLPKCYGRELGPQALVERWAVAWFCVLESDKVRP